MITQLWSDHSLPPKLQFARRVTLLGATFTAALCLFIAAGYVSSQSVDPLELESLESLRTQYHQGEGDPQLAREIQSLDLLARKAYFTHRAVLNGAGLLLAISLAVTLAAAKYCENRVPRSPSPRTQNPHESVPRQTRHARWAVATFGGALVASFLLLATPDHAAVASTASEEATAFTPPDRQAMAKNWPNFRGLDGNGHASPGNYPTTWNGEKGENILWKVKLEKPGFSSPIVWEDTVFITAGDKDARTVSALDLASGEGKWAFNVTGVPGSPEQPPKVTPDTGHAASTPATDGHHVYAIFSTGDLVALDFSGKKVWAKNLGVPDNHYGHSSSLITHQDLLLVQYDTNDGGRLLAVQCQDGAIKWDIKREVGISWASPIVVNTGTREELILNSNPLVTSYNPVNGQLLWSVEGMGGEVAPSPAFADGLVFAVNEYAILMAIDPKTSEVKWESDMDLSEVSSPIATAEYYLSATSYGSLVCLQAKSGEEVWFQETDHGFYGSPILVGDTVYITDRSGTTHVFKLGDSFNAVAQNPLGEKSDGTPAFARDRILLRGYQHLYCIGNK